MNETAQRAPSKDDNNAGINQRDFRGATTSGATGRPASPRYNEASVAERPPYDGKFVSMPEIHRLSMIPCEIERSPLRRLWRAIFARGARANDSCRSAVLPEPAGWHLTAKRRRLLLALLVMVQTVIATWSLARTFPGPELSGLEIAISMNFAILFSWLSLSFWTNMAGFLVLWRNRKFQIHSGRDVVGDLADQPLRSRTAVVMPIYNEDAARCFAGIEAIYRSVADTGEIEKFDFFILSDTSDPERLVEEEVEWVRICHALAGFGRIFYRHRRNNIKRKSGNIADFLRRWGQRYDYMVVLDADSIMSGDALRRLARMMDRSPQVGLIQTAPTVFNGSSLYARVQQFASSCYGPLLTASLHFWQLGESCYWGHNAIIRVAPFIKHCGLARLSGRPPFGGEILSHDFVEAAFLGRAGWEVWLAYDLPGSYEESPPTLLDELKRDQRWCQGNMQHLRLLLGDHLKTGHRATFVMGIMAYASALCWLCFLLLSSVEFSVQTLIPPDYFPDRPNLFPVWPEWHPEWAIALISTTALLLFLPKFLSLALILKNRQSRQFGGFLRLFVSVVFEIVISTLLAPLRMWFHSKFVFLTLLGRQIKWTAQCRVGNATGWLEATRAHGFSSVLAAIWIGYMAWLNPTASVWALPVALPLLISVPISVVSSHPDLGSAIRRWRLLQIPAEYAPPAIISGLRDALHKREQAKPNVDGFTYATLDPFVNFVHLEMLRRRSPKPPKARERNRTLRELALAHGPAKLSRIERAYLLKDADSMTVLHHQVLHSVDSDTQYKWGVSLGAWKNSIVNQTRLANAPASDLHRVALVGR